MFLYWEKWDRRLVAPGFTYQLRLRKKLVSFPGSANGEALIGLAGSVQYRKKTFLPLTSDGRPEMAR